MNVPSHDNSAKKTPPRFHRPVDVVDLVVDSVRDTTRRPLPPEVLTNAQRLRDLIDRWGPEVEVLDVIVDKPGDTTVRPIPPELLANAQRMQALIKEWEGKELTEPTE